MKKGFTLVEVLLSAVLGLLLLGLFTTTLVPLLHISARGVARADMVQAASLAAARLIGDCQRAPLTGLTLPSLTAPGSLAIQPVVNITDTGIPIWGQTLIVYRWDGATRTLSRKLWPPSPPVLTIELTPAGPVRLGPADLQSIISQSNGTEKALAAGIKEFSLRRGSVTNSLPLRLRMLFEQGVPGKSPEQYEHIQDFYLRNGAP